MVSLDESSVLTAFVSQNLDRLPNFNPEELNSTFLLERVSNLEKKLKDHETTLTSHRFDILALQDNFQLNNTPSFNAVNHQKPPESSDNITRLNLSVDNFVNGHEHSKKVNTPNNKVKTLIDKFNSTTPNISYRQRKRRQSDSALVYKSNQSTAKLNSLNNFTVKKHLTSTSHSPKITPRSFNPLEPYQPSAASSKTFYSKSFSHKSHGGTFKSKNNFGKFNSSERSTDLFIYKVLDGSLNEVLDYCHNRGIYTTGGKCVSHPDANFKSFKITVKSQDLYRVNNHRFWPNGIRCKIFNYRF